VISFGGEFHYNHHRFDSPPTDAYSCLCVINNYNHNMLDTTGAALLKNSEAFAKLTTANGGMFTSCSAGLSSQSRYSTLDQ